MTGDLQNLFDKIESLIPEILEENQSEEPKPFLNFKSFIENGWILSDCGSYIFRGSKKIRIIFDNEQYSINPRVYNSNANKKRKIKEKEKVNT